MGKIIFPRIQRLLLINPYAWYARGVNESTIYPPVGLSYVAAIAERCGIQCAIIDAAVLKLPIESCITKIKSFSPDCIGITSNIVTAQAAINTGKEIRTRFPEIPLVFGGPYATAYPEYILQQTKGYLVVRGEAEETIKELLTERTPLSSILGISYSYKNTYIHTNQRPLIKDINIIPFPAYHLLPPLSLYKSRNRRTPMGVILSSRGCPYQCIYCNANIFGKQFRPRSVENVLEEIHLLINKYHIQQLDILDDNFTLLENRAEAIFDGIITRKHNILINLQNGVRADRLTTRLIKKMKQAGVYKATIGVETADLGIQKTIKKSLSLPKVIWAIKQFRKEGIITACTFIFGLPGETKKTIERTITFAIRANPHIANFSALVPLPQTAVYQMIQKDGAFLQPIEYGLPTGFITDKLYFTLGSVNQQLVSFAMSKAFKQFYFRPVKFVDIIKTILSWKEILWTVNMIFDVIKNIHLFSPIKKIVQLNKKSRNNCGTVCT